MNVQRGIDGRLRPAEFYVAVRVKGGLPKRMLAAFRDHDREYNRRLAEAVFQPIDFLGQRMMIVR